MVVVFKKIAVIVLSNSGWILLGMISGWFLRRMIIKDLNMLDAIELRELGAEYEKIVIENKQMTDELNRRRTDAHHNPKKN